MAKFNAHTPKISGVFEERETCVLEMSVPERIIDSRLHEKYLKKRVCSKRKNIDPKEIFLIPRIEQQNDFSRLSRTMSQSVSDDLEKECPTETVRQLSQDSGVRFRDWSSQRLSAIIDVFRKAFSNKRRQISWTCASSQGLLSDFG